MTRLITRWNPVPVNEMLSLRDAFSRLMEDSVVHPGWSSAHAQNGGSATLQLPMDAYATQDEIVITLAVPGVKPDEVEIVFEGDTLSIRGELPAPLTNVSYLAQERTFGRFERTVVFNVTMQPEKAVANFENGLLTITVPKAEAVRPRTIKVATKS